MHNKGVTLASLAIIIIVILIISGTAIYTGIEVIADTKQTVFVTELKAIQAKVNLYYDENKENSIPSKTYNINNKSSNIINYPNQYIDGDKLIFNITGTQDIGTHIIYTVPESVDIQIEARGAAGSPGNRAAGIENPGGRGAYIKTDTIHLNKNDQLLIVVGQKGSITPSYQVSDGTSGGGGGGTFIFKLVSSSSYYVSTIGRYVEPLVIAAGGNGGNDGVYTTPLAGADGIANNGSSATGLTTSTYGFINRIVGYNYTRSLQTSKGGYGCGRGQNDNNGIGGGYTFGTADSGSNTGSYSYYNGIGKRITGENSGDGQVSITFLSGLGSGGETIQINVGQEISSVSSSIRSKIDQLVTKFNIQNINEYRYLSKNELEQIGISGIDRRVIINFNTKTIYDIDGVKIDNILYYNLDSLGEGLYQTEYYNKNQRLPEFDIKVNKVNATWEVTITNIQYSGDVGEGDVTYRLHGETAWKQTKGFSFIVNEVGSYEVKLTDKAGNENIKYIEI